MNYRNMSVKDVPSELLLFELLQRNGVEPVPIKTAYAGDWVGCSVGIGSDHTATIRMPLDDKRELDKIIAAKD